MLKLLIFGVCLVCVSVRCVVQSEDSEDEAARDAAARDAERQQRRALVQRAAAQSKAARERASAVTPTLASPVGSRRKSHDDNSSSRRRSSSATTPRGTGSSSGAPTPIVSSAPTASQMASPQARSGRSRPSPSRAPSRAKERSSGMVGSPPGEDTRRRPSRPGSARRSPAPRTARNLEENEEDDVENL